MSAPFFRTFCMLPSFLMKWHGFTKPDKCGTSTWTILWSSSFFISSLTFCFFWNYNHISKTEELSHRITSIQIFAVTSCHAEQLSHTPIIPRHFVLLYLCELQFFFKRKCIEIKHYNCRVYYSLFFCQLGHQFTPFVCMQMDLAIYYVLLCVILCFQQMENTFFVVINLTLCRAAPSYVVTCSSVFQ